MTCAQDNESHPDPPPLIIHSAPNRTPRHIPTLDPKQPKPRPFPLQSPTPRTNQQGPHERRTPGIPRPGLTEADLLADPVEQARRWVDEAIDANLPLANAMTLATVSADGRPSSRVVLLKGIEDGGFVFFTHYDSRKGDDIAANPNVSFVMFWGPFDRQLIVNGRAEKLDPQQSRDYFASRPATASSAPPSPRKAAPPPANNWKRTWPTSPSNTRKVSPSPCPKPGAATASPRGNPVLARPPQPPPRPLSLPQTRHHLDPRTPRP
ncbi:Pyridoxine/pyridoxamine 5'-phosphate oxidase [Alcanivorax sp. ALC70]|nr:Pyridoxine/pyridoxamine 5'-phosphate oxidase [Alcanivorax sp. ALC70]